MGSITHRHYTSAMAVRDGLSFDGIWHGDQKRVLRIVVIAYTVPVRKTWPFTYIVRQHDPETDITQRVFKLQVGAMKRREGTTTSRKERVSQMQKGYEEKHAPIEVTRHL